MALDPPRLVVPRRELILATPEGRRSGLRSGSVIATDHLVTVLDGEVLRVPGSWPDMTPVDAALRHTPGP